MPRLVEGEAFRPTDAVRLMNRILVVLPNWYGETLFATPFLRGLRAHMPGAFIATLSWPQCQEILVHNPSVNELIAFDERSEWPS